MTSSVAGGGDVVTCEAVGGVTTLTLNRPDVLNALDHRVFEALRARLTALADDPDVGCVVLRGAGRSFSSGHDLASLGAGDVDAERIFAAETIDLLERLPVPTIAMIHGHCFTGALELALACDLLVASHGATFADTHGQWGLVPVWGMSVRLPERIGRARAKQLMFTSARIDGATAARIGLVDRCVPDEALEAEVGDLARDIVANSRGTNRIVKALIDGSRPSRDDALAHERSLPFGWPDDLFERLGGRSGRR